MGLLRVSLRMLVLTSLTFSVVCGMNGSQVSFQTCSAQTVESPVEPSRTSSTRSTASTLSHLSDSGTESGSVPIVTAAPSENGTVIPKRPQKDDLLELYSNFYQPLVSESREDGQESLDVSEGSQSSTRSLAERLSTLEADAKTEFQKFGTKPEEWDGQGIADMIEMPPDEFQELNETATRQMEKLDLILTKLYVSKNIREVTDLVEEELRSELAERIRES